MRPGAAARTWLALALGVAFATAPLAADTPAQRAQKAAAAQKQLQQTRKRIEALAAEQKALEADRNAAAAALREADGRVAGGQRALDATNAQLAALSTRLAELEAQQATLTASLSKQRADLAALLRSAYALGQHEQLKLLLEQDRMGDLARVLAYHRYFERDRSARIGSLQQELQALAAVGEQVRARQAELAQAQARQQAELDALAANKRERTRLVSSLDAKYKDRKTRLAALGRDEKSTQALLEKLRKLMAQAPKPAPKPRPGNTGKPPPAADPKIPMGPMRLPLSGSVLAGYGGTMPDGHRSQGLLIAGSAGAEVQAVRAGRVAYADWLKGYGLLLILDHGNGWMSLYAFNETLLKNVGESVAAGEAISTVGSSGGQGRPALYFELRRNGQPQDPGAWLRR
jgi:septal ring factor EnvC (AmiA/AmiB activator)